MEMTSERLEFEKDNLYRYIPLPQYGDGMYKKELVMTKETFIECYSRWIVKSEVENGNDDR